MNFFKRFYGHLHTINSHRRRVRKHCFKCGLYWQGLTHDLSKYSFVEFWTGVKYFQGNRSPNTAEREEKGYTLAWLHHKGRNKHHMEYWIDYAIDNEHGMEGMKMPNRYVVEMFCDRVAACETYQKDKYTLKSAYDYYQKGKDRYMLHPETRALLVELLTMLYEKGEDETYKYIREVVLKK